MDWVLRSPQLQSLFGSLGFIHGETYHIHENCNVSLELILSNILAEDKYLRSFRRSVSFGQNIQKDLIPLLLHTKDDRSVELIIEILVNLTIPIECLLSVEVISNTDFGRLTVFELNNLLGSTKVAFTDQRATKAVIEFMKKNFEVDKTTKLSSRQCTNISNSLLLLRNILHIPDDFNNSANHTGHACQNKIIWNIFSQGVDKHLIKLMNIPESHNWGVTMVQVIALLYKDQHVVTLQKMLNKGIESSTSESSDDNESNTSPPDQRSEDSSPIPTSDRTSDTSEASGGKTDETVENWGSGDSISERAASSPTPFNTSPVAGQPPVPDATENTSVCSGSATEQKSSSNSSNNVNMNTKIISESSDYGYGTQIENQEVSTSSNDDETPAKEPVHQKPHNLKQRVNKNRNIPTTDQEKKRRIILKRGKAHIINVRGLQNKSPNNDEISQVLKEFTVDFLLKGYNSLVRTLYTQIVTNAELEIDVSHFLWLITYFLKFASQIELTLCHLDAVLCHDIAAYLTSEGVDLCEQFELAIKLDGNDLKPSVRRQHLVVTAIREFIQAIEAIKDSLVIPEEKEALVKLQVRICDTEELRSLFVLLLRNYNAWYHSKQYLQDLIVTNHFLLMFLDNVTKLPTYNSTFNMLSHIKQFASADVMRVYGSLLEAYASNGELVNDCIFTVMHHVGGSLGTLHPLFQPNILKTFTAIWEAQFELCDDWADLIEYVINTFIKKPPTLQNMIDVNIDCQAIELDLWTKSLLSKHALLGELPNQLPESDIHEQATESDVKAQGSSTSSYRDTWTEEELSMLNWNYMQCQSKKDVIGELVRLLKEDRVHKSRISVINQLHKQNIITEPMYQEYKERETSTKGNQLNQSRDDEIGKLCGQLVADGKEQFLVWVQRVLLQTCYVKLKLSYVNNDNDFTSVTYTKEANRMLYTGKCKDFLAISPVSYHCLKLHQSIPLVTWNSEQAAICKDLKFLQLLNKLGFYMPVDSDKVFIRIPHFWTSDVLFSVACKISSNHNVKLKRMIQGLSNCSFLEVLSSPSAENKKPPAESNNLHQMQRQTIQPSAVKFTPTPGHSHAREDKSDADVAQNWLQVVRRSQEIGLAQSVCKFVAPLPPGPRAAPPSRDHHSVCDTSSVASDLTRMFVSDGEDKGPTDTDMDHSRAGKRVCHSLHNV